VVCYGGSRGGAQASSVLPTPECQTFFLRFSLLLCACHRPRPAWALPPSPSSAFAPANAAFSSRVRKRPFFASAQLLVCLPSAVFSCPSCLCHRLRLTRQSRGRRISGRSSPHTASRGAPHFYVSALHYFVMRHFLPIPPLHLSVTVRGLVRVAIAPLLAALWSSAAQAFVGARRASSPSRLHAFRSVLRCSRLAVRSVPAVFSSIAWVGGRGAHQSPLLGSSPASVVAVSTRLFPGALTRRSTSLLSVAGRCAINPRSAG
jgi:hypothetical protein